MKVRVVITVEVDPEEWAREYSMVETDLKTVREDVHEYVKSQPQYSYAGESGLLKVL